MIDNMLSGSNLGISIQKKKKKKKQTILIFFHTSHTIAVNLCVSINEKGASRKDTP